MRNVHHARSVAEAYRVRDLLRQHGIDAEVSNEIRSQKAGGMPLDLSTVPAVWIADEARAKEAQEIVATLEARDGGEPWTCPACGETVPGSFTDCWRCASS